MNPLSLRGRVRAGSYQSEMAMVDFDPNHIAEDNEESSTLDKVVYLIEESQASKTHGVGTVFQAVCPELLITAFGDSSQEARNGLRLQVAEYLEDCDNLGVLDETLIEAGFYFDDDVWMSSEVKPVDGPNITIL